MEKHTRLLRPKKSRPKLPTIQNSASNSLLVTKPKVPSTAHLKQLGKLYNHCKSNVNILTQSPYYTNRTHKNYGKSPIEKEQWEPTQEQIKNVQEKYAITEELRIKNRHLEEKTIEIRLHAMNTVLPLNLSVKTVEEMELLVKRQYAIQQLKSHGCLKTVSTIGGFFSFKANGSLDYLLSLKQLPIPQGKYDLQPWYFLPYDGNATLKDFQIIRCLGSGGFSLVYLARDKFRGEFHALKLIDKKFILQSQREMIVENERYVLGQLKSPFVTPLRFCFETKNHFAFAIEYCPGGQLFYQLKKVRRMTQDQARFYFLQILIGLDHIHRQGILYRDLKPQNLLIGADGHIRIADFGLAKPLMGRSQAYSFCGSPQYMAPEMLLKLGHRNTLDYYCLGALLYELVVGVPPYYSLDHDEIYKGVLNEEISFPERNNLSNDIKSLLTGLLQKNPLKRLGSMHGVKEIMIHPWIGRITRKDIEDKKMKPPFYPDLSNFNFDETQLDERTKNMPQKISQDMRYRTFQTHFNQQFYYANPAFVPSVTKKVKTSRGHLIKSLQKGKKTRSELRRVASDRLKSK